MALPWYIEEQRKTLKRNSKARVSVCKCVWVSVCLGRIGEELKRPGPSSHRPPRIMEQGRSHILQLFPTSTKDLSFIQLNQRCLLLSRQSYIYILYMFSSLFWWWFTVIKQNCCRVFSLAFKEIGTKQSPRSIKIDKRTGIH